MSMLGGLGLSTLPSYAALQQQGLNSGGDALSRSLQFGASLYHDTAERKKDRKAQEEAKKKAQKEQRKGLLTSLAIGGGAAVVGAGLGAALAPALAGSSAAATGAATIPTTSAATGLPLTAGGAAAQNIGLTTGATAALGGSSGAVASAPAASLVAAGAPLAGTTTGVGAGTGALVGGGAGFAGGTGAGLSSSSVQDVGQRSTSGINAGNLSGVASGGNAPQYTAPSASQLAEQGGYSIRGPGDRLKLFGALAGKNLLNTLAPGTGESLNPILNSPAYNFNSALGAGQKLANTSLEYARLGEQSRQFDAAEAGRDRRLGLQESGRDRRLGVTEQGRNERAADTLALGRDNLALDQQGLEERRRQFDVGEQGRNTRQQVGIDASRSLAEFSEQGRNNRLNLTEQGRNERANPFYGLGVGPGNTLGEIGVPTPEGGLLGPQNTAAQAAMAQKLYGNQGLRPTDSGEITPRDEARNKLDASRQISDLIQTIGNPKTRKELMQENPNLLGQLEALTTDLGQSYNVKTNVSADEAFTIIKGSLDNGDFVNAEQQLTQYAKSIGDPVKIQQLRARIDEMKRRYRPAYNQLGISPSISGID